jgi:hypothetical protein
LLKISKQIVNIRFFYVFIDYLVLNNEKLKFVPILTFTVYEILKFK